MAIRKDSTERKTEVAVGQILCAVSATNAQDAAEQVIAQYGKGGVRGSDGSFTLKSVTGTFKIETGDNITIAQAPEGYVAPNVPTIVLPTEWEAVRIE